MLKGDVPSGKTEDNRILDKYLKFKFVEVNEDDTETVIFTDKSYDDISNKRIHVETIPKNQRAEYNKTYRLYMVINDKLIIGNTSDAEMTLEEFQEVFASVKVSVTGDFEEKEVSIEYTDESCFETGKSYVLNDNLTSDELNICVTYLTNNTNGWSDLKYIEQLVEDETLEEFCQGTGTLNGRTFEDYIYDGKNFFYD